jgi:methyl-accepting chemotaxis protein
MQAQKKPKGRRVYLINPGFQLRMLGAMGLLAAAVIGALYGANAYFFWKFSLVGTEVGLPPDHVFYEFINEQRGLMNWVFASVAGVVVVVIGLGGLLLSHKIAGPLHRLRTHMDAVAEGTTSSDVAFRKGDFFGELATSFNAQLAKARNPKRKFVGGRPRPQHVSRRTG